MPSARRSITLLIAFIVAAAIPSDARADEVDDLIQLMRTKPDGMDRAEWKEKRRSGAKKLGTLGDKRAVDVLIWLVETEEFDVVAENAIAALGKLGDEKAEEILQSVYADKSRERYVRQLAKTALAKLGSKPDGRKGDKDDDKGDGAALGGGGGASIGDSDAEVPDGPTFGEDVLGSTHRLTFALGTAHLEYDTVRDRPELDGSVAAEYERTIDYAKKAYRYGGDAELAGGAVDFDGADSASRVGVLSVEANGEARFYTSGGTWYGMLNGALGGSTMVAKVDRPPNNNGGQNTDEVRFSADVHGGLAVGYGRVLDMGEALRLRRIELLLEKAGQLGRPIAPDLAERIMRAWWSLRGEQGTHDRLVVTVTMLREAGVLLGEPDASTTYKILQVLEDGALDHRPRGLDINLGVAESYLIRDDAIPVEDGRVESVLLRATYGRQSSDGTSEIVGQGFGRYRILAPDGSDSPYAVGAVGAWRRYVYNDNQDLSGALEFGAEAALAKTGEDFNLSGRLGGFVGWQWIPSRASRFRLTANVAVESEEIFFGASFEATYGLLDVGYVGAGGYGTLK
jgi:hypothetical protein